MSDSELKATLAIIWIICFLALLLTTEEGQNNVDDQ